MCGMFNLSVWDDQADYLILDDISFEFIGGSRKSLWGSQKELTLTDKFVRKRAVKWGKPMIFLCNADGDFRYQVDRRGQPICWGNEKEWYEQNSVIVEVTDQLF